MAFPSANGSIPLTLEAAWSGARNAAAQIASQSLALQAAIPNGVRADQILSACNFFAALNAQLTQYAAVPGLAAYAQAQISEPGENIVADFASMQTALVNVVTWIVQNFPLSTYTSFNGSGFVQYVSFTPGQLSALASLLTALSATIT